MKKHVNLKVVLIGMTVVLTGAATYFAVQFHQALPTATGYTAKYVCSSVFLSGRKEDPASIIRNEIVPIHPSFGWIDTQVDFEQKTVSSSGFAGLGEVTAVYREGLGCTLNIGVSIAELRTQAQDIQPPAGFSPDADWPFGDVIKPGVYADEIDHTRLEEVLNEAFQEPYPGSHRNTRAVVVVYRGELVAERYASGFDAHMPLTGWSMAKSVINALTGVLVYANKLQLDAPAPVSGWQQEEDARKQITLDQLLRMSSGLDFSEVYSPGSDASEMLFNTFSTAEYAASRPLAFEPDRHWAYSSGTTNIISGILEDTVGGTLSDYHRFAREQLFDRIGMHDTTFEPDPSGTFVGSSYLFASARDWARFGLLFLNDGVWQGQRILPEGWVDYTTTATPTAPEGQYGAQFWLNAGEPDDISRRQFPDLPPDLYWASGFNGQSVNIIPSRQLVIVRLGTTLDESWDNGAFLVDLLSAFPEN